MQQRSETYELQHDCVDSCSNAANDSANAQHRERRMSRRNKARKLLFECYDSLVHEELSPTLLSWPSDRHPPARNKLSPLRARYLRKYRAKRGHLMGIASGKVVQRGRPFQNTHEFLIEKD
jgi:hypothetical protein